MTECLPHSEPAGALLWGAVLVGGRSERMGCDKAGIFWAGEVLGERQMGVLSLCCERVAAAAPVRPEWLSGDREWVKDSVCGRGPAAGVLGALDWLRTGKASHVMVLAVDMPLASVGLVSMILAERLEGRGVVPRCDEGFEPLCACYPVGALDYLSAWMAAGEHKMQTLVARLVEEGWLAEMTLSPSEKLDFFNMNTPEDLACLQG